MIQNDNEIELCESITKDATLRPISLHYLKRDKEKPVFILCKNSIEKYPNIDINKLVNKQYTRNEIALFNRSTMRLEFNFDEIMSFNKAKLDFFIVNKSLLLKIGISEYFLISTNIFYFTDNNRKFLYFKNEQKLLMIESGYATKPSNQNINNYINNKNNINNGKIEILKFLILLYANEKELSRLYSNNLPNKYDLKDYYMINKSLMNDLMDKFYYNKIKNILSNPKYSYLKTYEDIIKNLEKLQKNEEIKNVLSLFWENEDHLIKQGKLLPEEKYHPKNSSFKWPNNFVLIHQTLFDILKQFKANVNHICNYQKNYKKFFGKSTLYIISEYNQNNIYAYIFENNRYILLCIINYDSNLFYSVFNQHLKNKSLIQYIIEKKYDINNFDHTQNIKDLNTNQVIGVLVITYKINDNIKSNNNNIKANINNNNIKSNNNSIIKNNNEYNNKVENNENNKNENINDNDYNNNTNDFNNENNNNYINNNKIKEEKEKQNKEFDTNYSIYKNYIKFKESLKNYMEQNYDLNLDISNINDLEPYLSGDIIKSMPVFLITNDKLKYFKESFNFKYFDQLEKTTYNTLKSSNMETVVMPDLSTINSYIEILSLEEIKKNMNIIYSFVDEDFCKDVQLKTEKYKPLQALLFVNKKQYLLYFKNSKTVLKLNNFNANDNTFKLSKSDFKPPIPFRESDHCKGLENIGATCYMNATLQCLSHSTSFKKYFINKEGIQRDTFNNYSPMSNSFYEIVTNLWKSSNEKYYAPYNFKNLISELNPLFKGIQANDSKDLIIFIYETLHKELNNPNSDDIKLTNVNNSNIPNELKEFRNNYYSQNKSIIVKIFYSEQSNNLKCCSCNFNKVSYNIISFLIFPLEKIRLLLTKKKPNGFANVSLEDCFEMNEESEILNGQNQIFCNNCHRCSDALSYNKLYNCPEVLTIILNRGKGLQFDVEFKFPLYINIEKYVIDKSCETNYELIGVLTHLGPSGMSGHFIAYCKSPVDNNWYCYNDSQVSKCIDAESEINSRGIPYVLFYQLKNIFILYFNYNEKELYLEINENDLFKNILNQLFNRYSWIPKKGIGFYTFKNEASQELDKDKTIYENGLKNYIYLILKMKTFY